MDRTVTGFSRQSHQQSCSGPCSTSYALPILSHRLLWGSATRQRPDAQLRASAAGAEPGVCRLPGITALSQSRSSIAHSALRHQPLPLSRSPVSTRVATPLAPTEAVQSSEEDEPPAVEQPAPFERMTDDADSAYADLAGIVSTDALYDVLDLRKELAKFLQEADKPLTAGLAGLQEIASSANWSLPVCLSTDLCTSIHLQPCWCLIGWDTAACSLSLCRQAFGHAPWADSYGRMLSAARWGS